MVVETSTSSRRISIGSSTMTSSGLRTEVPSAATRRAITRCVRPRAIAPGYVAPKRREEPRGAPLVLSTSPLVATSGRRVGTGGRGLEVHVTHAAATHGAGTALLGGVGDDGLGGEEQGRDRGCVLQRRAGHLGGIDDA